LVTPLSVSSVGFRIFGAALVGIVLSSCSIDESVSERHILSGGTEVPPSPGPSTIPSPVRRPAGVESFGTPAASPAITRTTRTLPVVTGTRQVQLDFNDAPITSVVNQVVGDILQLPLTVDGDVTGRMSLRATGIPISEVPARLDQALQQHGYGLAAVGDRVRVGRIAVLNASGGPDQIETRIIPLHYVQATDLIAAIQQNAPDSVRVVVDPSGRGIVASGPSAAINLVQELVALFDVDTLRSRSFGVYPLVNTTPGAVVGELNTIFSTSSAQKGPRFAAIDRLNAVLVVADTADGLVRARQVIAGLDTAPDATASVHVYPLQFRRAVEVADVLSRTFGTDVSTPVQPASPVGSFANLSVGSPNSTSASLGVRPPGMPTPAAVPSANSVSGPQAQTTAAERAAELGLTGPVRIEADPGRNALVILAAPADYKVIEQTIQRLDVRPRQVFIEAAIAEVTLTDSLKFGVDYALKTGDSTFIQSTTLAASDIAGGFSYVLRGSNIALTLQALSTFTTVKMISAPRILVLDNGTATLQVGNQVPILTESSQSQEAANAPVVNQVELRDTGVILAVTPRIGSGSSISLDIFQEVSAAIATTSSGINSPTIQLRRVQSTVSVQSGETVALGGLMQDLVNNGHSGIPILSSIPIVGNLFGTRTQQTTRTELLVMLTPRVVGGSSDTQAVTDELRTKLGTLAPDVAAAVTPAAPGNSVVSRPPSRRPRLNIWQSN
jgi:general secretion pathway protein D